MNESILFTGLIILAFAGLIPAIIMLWKLLIDELKGKEEKGEIK